MEVFLLENVVIVNNHSRANFDLERNFVIGIFLCICFYEMKIIKISNLQKLVVVAK